MDRLGVISHTASVDHRKYGIGSSYYCNDKIIKLLSIRGHASPGHLTFIELVFF